MNHTPRTYIFLILLTTLFAPLIAFAQEDGAVKLLAEGIPGVSNQGGSLEGYLQGLFQLGLGIAVVLAVLQIVLGGFQYMTTDAAGGKEEGKDKIRSAIGGLILALATVLILQTINPDILDLKIEFGDSGGQQQDGGGDGGDDSTGQLPESERRARERLTAAGINIYNPCPPGQNRDCTNVAGLPSDVFSSLERLREDCECALTVTGGTEDGHVTHGVGERFVDLGKDGGPGGLDSYITQNASCRTSTPLGNLYKVGNTNYVNEGSHWHSCVGVSCRIKNPDGTPHAGTC